MPGNGVTLHRMYTEMFSQDKLAKDQLDAEWIKAAEAALEKNISTVAVLWMFNLKGPRSYIDKLRAHWATPSRNRRRRSPSPLFID